MEDYTDPIVTAGELLLTRAEGAISSQDPNLMLAVAKELAEFNRSNELYLDQHGYGWLNDQIQAAWGQVTGNQPGTAENPNKYTTSAAAKQSVVGSFFRAIPAALSKSSESLEDKLGKAGKWAVVAVVGIAIIKIVDLIRR